MLQKWEKEVDTETILHPTPSVNRVPPNSIPSDIVVGTLPTPSVNMGVDACDKVASTPLDPIPPSSIPSEIVVATPCADSPPTSHTGCRRAEQILANVCKALSDSQGTFRPSLAEVEALLGDDWGPPLHATVPGPSAQQYEFEARHFRDLTSQSYVTDCAQIVVYYCWAARTALSADWDTMGVAWAVRDSLWNASCASPQRRQALVESWAHSTLERASIDMSFAPPLIVAQVYNSGNFHWVLRLLLIAPTREYLLP